MSDRKEEKQETPKQNCTLVTDVASALQPLNQTRARPRFLIIRFKVDNYYILLGIRPQELR